VILLEYDGYLGEDGAQAISEISEATVTTIVNVSSGTTLALSEVLGIASRMRCVDEDRLYKIERDGEG
jgi:hypothetical protein